MNAGRAGTGHTERRADGTYVALTRTFRAPIEDVWAAVTEPAGIDFDDYYPALAGYYRALRA